MCSDNIAINAIWKLWTISHLYHTSRMHHVFKKESKGKIYVASGLLELALYMAHLDAIKCKRVQ
jgi:hypothetical protein